MSDKAPSFGDLVIRRDDWSIQFTTPGHDTFFLRLLTKPLPPGHLEFSDFSVDTQHIPVALAALSNISETYQPIQRRGRIIVQNIYPGYAKGFDKNELSRRHLMITKTMRRFCTLHGLSVLRCDLVAKDYTFNTEVYL